LQDGHNAFIAETGDGPGLAAAVKRVLADPEQALKVAMRARKEVERLDWRERARRISAFCAGL
jgi:glycosyltransferase involved in cell wall biosynthesis